MAWVGSFLDSIGHFFHLDTAVNGTPFKIRAMLRHVLYFTQHLLQVDWVEYGIDATIADTGRDSV